MIQVIEVSSKKEIREFVRFPDRLYKHCCQWVPAIHSAEVYSLTKYPALEYCSRKMWLAVREGKTVGRICAMINPRFNKLYGKKRVRFGWFDAVDDFEVAQALFKTAESWAKKQGMTEIHGPLFYNTLGKQGMLVEGYENVPPFNCLYNYPYYNDFLDRLGFVKECDWIQYKLVANHGVPEKTRRMAKIVMEKYNLHFANLDELKKDPERVHRFFEVYNKSFAPSVINFIPFTEAEIAEEAKYSMPYLSDKTSSIVLDENEDIVAFGISFPSISKALQKAKGHLFPFGWLHLMKALSNYETTDLMINGAVPEWQHKGVSSIFYKDMADKALKIGNRWAISNPQQESNTAVNIWNDYEHEPYMRRRCYIKDIQ